MIEELIGKVFISNGINWYTIDLIKSYGMYSISSEIKSIYFDYPQSIMNEIQEYFESLNFDFEPADFCTVDLSDFLEEIPAGDKSFSTDNLENYEYFLIMLDKIVKEILNTANKGLIDLIKNEG
jgi:hypothetical protein